MYRGRTLNACLCAALLAGPPARLQATAGQTGVERARSDRLLAPERLSEMEVQQLIVESAAAVDGRPLRVRDGDTTVVVDAQARAMLFLILSGTVPVEDVGLREGSQGRVRGLRASATPPRSEVGAKQTLWIDVATRLPQRFEFTYEVPGLGDLAYDLLID